MTMPKLTGDQLARKIHLVRPDVSLILCTGYIEAMETAMAGGAAYAAVFMKALMIDALIHTVGRVLDKPAKRAAGVIFLPDSLEIGLRVRYVIGVHAHHRNCPLYPEQMNRIVMLFR